MFALQRVRFGTVSLILHTISLGHDSLFLHLTTNGRVTMPPVSCLPIQDGVVYCDIAHAEEFRFRFIFVKNGSREINRANT